MRPPLEDIPCAQCGVEFTPTKRGHRYCTAACRYQGEREPHDRPLVDHAQVRRLFDEARDPEERVRPDGWTATPQFAHVDTFDTLRKRRGWYEELKARGML